MKFLLTLLMLLSVSAWAEGRKYKATLDPEPNEKQVSESVEDKDDKKREPASEEEIGHPDLKIHVNDISGTFK